MLYFESTKNKSNDDQNIKLTWNFCIRTKMYKSSYFSIGRTQFKSITIFISFRFNKKFATIKAYFMFIKK